MIRAVEEISPRDAHTRLNQFRAVDVRAEHEFRGPLGHVPGSFLVPLPELEERVMELPRDRPLLLVCRSGNRSATACRMLAKKGIESVVNLAGGMIAWNRAGLPTAWAEPGSLGELLELVMLWFAQVRKLVPGTARELAGSHEALFESPTHAAVARAIDSVEDSLESSAPPDLDLSIAAFRRWLAVL